jgi:hypothetical protein
VLVPHRIHDVAVFAPPTDDDDAAVLALLPDGEARSSSRLALALGASQLTVQRAADGLAARNKVRSLGRLHAALDDVAASRFQDKLVTHGCTARWLG